MYNTIDEIKTANQAAGRFFFDPHLMELASVQVYPEVYNGKYFVISDQFITSSHRGPRVYSVCLCTEEGKIEFVGEPGFFMTLETVQAYAKTLS